MNTIHPPFEIKIEPTPWDSKVFDINTFEISMSGVGILDIEKATEELNDITAVTESSLFYCRTNANNRINKTILNKSGFFNCETQLLVVNNINKNTIPVELGKRRLQIDVGSDQDYFDVAEKSSDIFEYSRFHEDPFVSKRLSNLRMKYWCHDMHRQKIPLLVFRNNVNELNSFIFYRQTDDRNVELILGGSMPGRGILTPLFWASFIDYFNNLGIRHIETRISASNIVIANIYLFFDFKIKSTYFDFHKHVRCNLSE
jgi:hypothetical protein